jgi:Zn-finger nucleic acid-binding protein
MPTPTGHPSIACPGCGSAMIEEDHGPACFDRCTSCGAYWFDRGELEALLEARGSDHRLHFHFAGHAGKTERRCPRCDDAALWTYHLGQIPIDRCWRCRGLLLRWQHLEAMQRDAPRQDPGPASGSRVPPEVLGLLLDVIIEMLP